jgi:hypothetical protein
MTWPGLLVQRRVAITSTLAVIESFAGRNVHFDPALLSPRLRSDYIAARTAWANPVNPTTLMWAGVGSPSQNIAAVRNVELVLKNGVGYDPAKLRAAVEGSVGEP